MEYFVHVFKSVYKIDSFYNNNFEQYFITHFINVVFKNII